MKYLPQSDVHRTEGRKLFSRKNNMLTNHDSNRNRNMSRTNEGKESETNEDKQKNEVRDTFTTTRAVLTKRDDNRVQYLCFLYLKLLLLVEKCYHTSK